MTPTIQPTAINLPAEMQSELMALMRSPQQYYSELKAVRPDEYAPSNSLPIGLIKRHAPKEHSMMLIGFALMEVRDWFNVSYNLTSPQIAMLSELILDRYFDYTLGEIKGALHRKLAEGKVYNRIDPNTIMLWLSEYDLLRDQASEQTEVNKSILEEEKTCVSASDWLSSLQERAANGDTQSQEVLAQYEENQRHFKKFRSAEQIRKNEMDFLIFKHNYEKGRKKHRN